MTAAALRRRSARWAVLCILLTVAPARAGEASGAPTAESTDDNVRARALYRDANALFKAGKLAEARRGLLEAWKLRQTYDIASALGQIEIELQLYRDAAQHLEFAIQHFSPVESERTLHQTNQAFASVKQRVAAVHVIVDQPGAAVFVDGEAVGTAPLSAPIFLDPGTHSVEARLGGDVVAKTMTVEAGKDHSITLAIGAEKTSDVALGSAIVENKPGEKSLVPVVVGGAVALVGLGMGIGFRVAGNAHVDDAENLRDGIPRGGCEAPAPSETCSALERAASDADRNVNLSTAGFALAGVAAVSTVAYWVLWPNDRAIGASTPKVGGGLSHGGAAVWIRSEF